MHNGRGRIAVLVGVGLPLLSGLAWILAGHLVTGAIGIMVAGVCAGVQRRRGMLRLRWPTFGDPNKRRPIIIAKARWPHG